MAYALDPATGEPLTARARRWLTLAAAVIIVLVLLPLLIVVGIPWLLALRRLERRDPSSFERPDRSLVDQLRRREDAFAHNPFAALGVVKAGSLRASTVRIVLLGISVAASCVFVRGSLAGVTTIHVARWVPLDGGRRMIFTSCYDGSLESYMNDFIDKLSWGLNVIFSNGVGLPTDPLADLRWRPGRADVQGLPALSPAGDGGLVRRAPDPDHGQHPRQRGHPARADHPARRCPGGRVAGVAVNGAELDDLQALLRSALRTLPHARYALYHLPAGADGRRFLATLVDDVTSAADRDASVATQVALTATGLAGLGVPSVIIDGFSDEFLAGMIGRSRFLGDTPEDWQWGRGDQDSVDLLVITYAATRRPPHHGRRHSRRSGPPPSARCCSMPARPTAAARWSRSGSGTASRSRTCPELASSADDTRRPTGRAGRVRARLPERVRSADPATRCCRRTSIRRACCRCCRPARTAAIPTAVADLGRNGTYLVLRTLAQDVAAFDAYVTTTAAGAGAGPRAARREDGGPLARRRVAGAEPGRRSRGAGHGQRLRLPPRRRPRTALPGRRPRPPGQSARLPRSTTRIGRLRRRSPIGTGCCVAAGSSPTTDGQQGLQFVALNANLGRQFEFVQHSWLNDPKFARADHRPGPAGHAAHPGRRVHHPRRAVPHPGRWAAGVRHHARRGVLLPARSPGAPLSGGWGLPGRGVVVKLDRLVNDVLVRVFWVVRRIDPLIRPLIDVAVRPWLQALVQWNVRRRLPDDGLALAEERELPGEAAATASIIAAMSRFTETTYAHTHAERAGNTKTYGVARAELTVADGLPVQLRHGLFARPDTYRAFVRFAGPGPTAPPDLHDNAIMSIGVKVLGVAGPKLLGRGVVDPGPARHQRSDVHHSRRGAERHTAARDRKPDAAVLLHPAHPPAPGGSDHAGAVRGHRRESAAGRLRQLRPLPAGRRSGRAVPVRAAARGVTAPSAAGAAAPRARLPARGHDHHADHPGVSSSTCWCSGRPIR